MLLPLLKQMGVEMEYTLVKRGLYPFGGGKILLKVAPCTGLKPLVLSERGKIVSIKLYSVCAEEAHIHFHKTISAKLKSLYPAVYQGDEIDYIDRTFSKGRRAHLRSSYVVVQSEKGSIQKAEVFWEGGKADGEFGNGEEGDNLLGEVKEIVENENVTVDEHHSDQVLIYMVLATGDSVMRIRELSLHFQTMCHILPMFLKDCKVGISHHMADKFPYYEIKVKGLGYKFTD